MTELKPLNFVTMLGSLRKASYNSAVSNVIGGLSPAGVTISPLGSVGDIPHFDADLQAEGFPQSVASMASAISVSDGVIFITPEYNYSIPGVLKNALDWLSRMDPQPFVGKPVSIITASQGVLGGVRAQYHLRQVLVYLDARVLNKPEVMVGRVHSRFDEEMRNIDHDMSDMIARHISAFAIFARR